jgi:hypothetical protein
MARGTQKKLKQGTISATELLQLHRWNRWLAIIHALEGVAIFLFATAYSVPIIINYVAVNPINSAVAGHAILSPATRQLLNVSIPGLIAIFFIVTAVAHGLLATVYRKRYEAGLAQGTNMIRWVNYAVSAGLMLVLIGVLTGVRDFATLIAIFGFMVVMNALGMITELTSNSLSTNWLAYWSGAIAGLLPWLIIALYLFNATYYGAAHIPTFVYGIYGTMFVCTVGFASNMYLHYKKQGRWASYVYTERGFMIMSLVTQTLLAWQVFVGILRP